MRHVAYEAYVTLGVIWDHLGQFGIIWGHWGSFGVTLGSFGVIRVFVQK